MPKNDLFCLSQHRMDVIGGMSSVRHGTEAISETVQTIRQTSADSVAYIKLEGAQFYTSQELNSPYSIILWGKFYRKNKHICYT